MVHLFAFIVSLLVFSTRELSSLLLDYKSTSADYDELLEEVNIKDKQRWREICNFKHSHKIQQSNSDNDSVSSLSYISQKYVCDETIDSNSFFSKGQIDGPIISILADFSCSKTLNCVFYDGEKNFVVVYIEQVNEYNLFSKDFIMKLLEFFNHLTIEESFIYVNRKHKEFCIFF